LRDLSKEELALETRIYRFLHQINIVSDTAKRLGKKGDDLSVTVEMKEDGPLQMNMAAPHPKTITELAVVLEPLIRESSDINYSDVLEFCRATKASPELDALVHKAATAAERIKKGAMGLNINGQEMTSVWVYERFMDRIFNADSIQAREYEANLDKDPIVRNMLFFQFYDYCLRMAHFLRWIQENLKAGKFLPPSAPRDYACVGCRKDGTQTRFSKAEHTMPEALGNTHSVLPRGYYCDECQDLLSPIEQRVVDEMPFAMTRLFFTKHTKSGTFPSAKLGAVHYTKTKPNHITIDVFAGQKVFPDAKDAGDGMGSFNLTAQAKFDHIPLGRVLVKAALGAMAIELGREYVLNSRFDSAREFVRTGKGLHARLLMVKNAKLRPEWKVRWWDFENGTTGVVMVVHGIEFAFPATNVPDEKPPPADVLAKAAVFDLWNPGPPPHYKDPPSSNA